MSAKLTFRETLGENDIAAVRALVAKAGVFSAEEIDIAAELAEDCVRRGGESDYAFVLAETDRIVGYTCFGRIPLTQGRYDLYWIVVDPDCRQRGIASRLLTRSENAIRALGGRMLFAETSSRSPYAPACAFYENNGFAELARLADFYNDGDAKLIFGKTL